MNGQFHVVAALYGAGWVWSILEKNKALVSIRIRSQDRPARRLVSIPTTLSSLPLRYVINL